MSVSANIKALLMLQEKKQSDLLDPLHMSSRQSLSNKFTNERWSVHDLAVVAKLCGCKLAFILPNGQQLVIEDDRAEKRSPGRTKAPGPRE